MTVNNGPVSSRLLELQTLDQNIRRTRDRIEAFGPLLEEVEEPALRLSAESEVAATKVRELELEERRLRLAAEEKRVRVHRLEDRLNLVRTVQQEAAVQAELGLVRRALDQEEQEVVNLLDQIARFQDRFEDLQAAIDEAREAVEPRRNEIVAEQEAAEAQVASMQLQRDDFAEGIDPRYRRVYDNLIRGGRRVAVAPMTADGACGSCYSVIPLQVQNEIRARGPLVLCEGCGVIVTSPAADAEADAEAESVSG